MSAAPPPATRRARIVVLASGHGSNLQSVIDACAAGVLNAQVVAVFSNHAGARALERARSAGIPAVAQVLAKGHDRRDYDAQLARAVAPHRPDWVILAGWMLILSAAFLDRFPGHVVNLHPALPGAFPGTRAIERAYAAARRGTIRETGVMVHLVDDEGVDSGSVVAQERVPIDPGDTLEALEARVHQVEHRVLVEALRGLIAAEVARPGGV